MLSVNPLLSIMIFEGLMSEWKKSYCYKISTQLIKSANIFLKKENELIYNFFQL